MIDFFSHYNTQEITAIINKFVTAETIWVGFSTTFMLPVSQDIPDPGTANQMYDKLWDTKILDYNSAFPFDRQTMLDMFDLIRSRNSSTKIVVGGARTWQALNYDGFIKKCRVDYYVQGYADTATVELTRWLHDSTNPEPKFIGRHQNVIDSTADYDYQEFNNSNIKFLPTDIVTPDEYLPIEIARGCIFKCKFCNFSLLGKKRGDYTKTKEALVNEFVYNYETHGTTNYMFMDETTNDSMEKAEFLLDVTSGLPFKIRWGGYARMELFANNPSMAGIMQETGMAHTFLGLETFNKRSGEVIGKGMHPDRVKEVLTKLKAEWQNRVRITAGLIVGLPYETQQTLNELEQYLLSDACSLDSWVIHPLMLVEGQPSMFGQDPGKYGYSFDRTKSRMSWKNNEMTFDDALTIAARIRNATDTRCRVNSWSHMRLQNLGYSEAEVDSWNVAQYFAQLDSVYDRKRSRKDQYYQKLMAL